MMTARLLKRLMLLGILGAFVLTMAPSMLTAGDGPEPGPPGATVPYTYVPPPFIGHMALWLEPEEEGYPPSLWIEGTAYQVGNSECYITFDDVLLAGWEDLQTGGFNGISCADLKPRDFIGNWTELTAPGVIFVCSDAHLEIEGIEIMAAANIKCFEDSEGKANSGSAKIIFMLAKPK